MRRRVVRWSRGQCRRSSRLRWDGSLSGTASEGGRPILPSHSIRLALVGRETLVTGSLAAALGDLLGRVAQVVGTATDARDASDLVRRTRPDVLLVDGDGLGDGVLARLRRDHPDVRILGIVDDGETDAVRRALLAGMDGVVPRSTDPDELGGPLLSVADGWFVLPATAARELIGRLRLPDPTVLGKLDDEEREIWARLAAGEHDRDLARRFHVSTRTMKRRVAALFRKLGVDGRVQAAELAGRCGVRRPDRDDDRHTDGRPGGPAPSL